VQFGLRSGETLYESRVAIAGKLLLAVLQLPPPLSVILLVAYMWIAPLFPSIYIFARTT